MSFESGQDHPTPIRILTPEIERSRPDEPLNLWIWSKKYGEVKSELNPSFEGEITKRVEYDIPIPGSVLKASEEVRALGGRALLVGGCVRDFVMAQELNRDIFTKDFDIEIYGLSPQNLQHVLERNFGQTNKEGESFAILKVPVSDSNEPLDVSIPRRESTTGVGHKDFLIEGDPTMTINEAALRRDLTMNTLAYDPLTKTLYDPYNGVGDIQNQIIEVTNNDAFQEDPLRVMRIMQFAARFEFSVSENSLDLCKEMVTRGDLDHLPNERITEEIKKLLLKSDKPSIGFEFAREAGIVARYWPELNALIDVPQEPEWHPEGDVWTHTKQVLDAAADVSKRENLESDERLALMLGALGHDFGKATKTQIRDGRVTAHGHEAAGVEPAKTFMERFMLPKKVRSQVEVLVADHMSPNAFFLLAKEGQNMDKAIRRLATRLGKGETSIKMISLIAEADQRGRNGGGDVPLKREDVKELDEWQNWLEGRSKTLDVEIKPPENLVSGKDVLAFLPPGIWVGVLLNALYNDQLDGLVEGRDDALARISNYAVELGTYVKLHLEGEPYSRKSQTVWEDLKRMEDPREVLNG